MKFGNFFTFIFILIVGISCSDDTATPAATSATNTITIKGNVVDSAAKRGLGDPETGIDPRSFGMRIYAVGFSLNEDCTDMEVVEISDDPESQDWVANPTLASADLADGSYECVAFEFNSDIPIVPDGDSLNDLCVAGEEFTLSVCQANTTSTLLDGTEATCTGSSDRITLYMSTAVSVDDECGEGCGFSPDNPTALTSPLVVSGTGSGTFTVDAMGLVGEYNSETECEMDEPTWGFE